MDERYVQILANLLLDNVGNKITPCLANGLIYTLVQEGEKLQKLEKETQE